MQGIIRKSLNDIFSPLVLSFILKVGFGSILFWIIALSIFWGEYASFVSSLISKIPFIGSWEWLQSGGSVLFALLLGYILIIITISTLTSLFSEPILIKLAKKHYQDIEVVGSPNIAKSLLITLKASGVFLGLFILTTPLLFVPILGQIWMLWLWSILLKEPTAYDVGSLFISDKSRLKTEQKKSRVISVIASLFNYIPILNIFAPLFGQILFLHHIISQSKENRKRGR
jgi:hypothetical protein